MSQYRYLIIALLWAASLAAVGVWQNDAGQSVERLAWSEREAVQLADAASETARLNDEARATEKQQAGEYAAREKQLIERQNNAKAKADAIISDIYNGYLRLRDRAATVQARDSGASQTTENTGAVDEAGGCELSKRLTEFLAVKAMMADDVVEQLTELQSAAASCDGSVPLGNTP